MTLQVEDYVGRARDSVRERDLVRELKTRPEDERLAFVQSLARRDLPVALVIAKRSLGKRGSYFRLLDQALDIADASNIRYWLEAIVPRLGMRRTVVALKSKVPSNPIAVKKALYWMPLFAKRSDYSKDAVRSILA